jgi:hypothetical protein
MELCGPRQQSHKSYQGCHRLAPARSPAIITLTQRPCARHQRLQPRVPPLRRHAVDAKWSATFSEGVIPDTLVQDRDVALSALRQFEGSAQIQGRFLSRVGHDAAPVRYRKSRPVDLNTGGSRALALTSSSESARRRVASASSLRFGLITVAPR